MTHATILFVENREKTAFFAAIARVLAARGHTIGWLVQNPIFGQGLPGTVHRLPFPPRGAPSADPADYPMLVTDRGRDFFEAGSAHYPHYAAHIARVLDTAAPDIIFGESTLFHELLTVGEARRRGIPFVEPTPERYPSGRFSLFEGATQHPYVASGDSIPHDVALALAGQIAGDALRPHYMQRRRALAQRVHQLHWALTRARVLAGRVRGERYNTPASSRKWALSRMVAANLARWRQLARAVQPGERAVLYPLQMQPESNVEVWGRPYHDQIATIRRLMAAAPAEVLVAVKANPKPKYEMSDVLMALAADEPRLRLLPLDTTMPAAMAQCVGAVTVTGTVGFEAVMGKGRCLSLRHPALAAAAPDHCATSPEDAVARLLADPAAGLGAPELGATLIEALVARSFAGMVNDPFSDPACIEPANIALVADAIEIAIIRALGQKGATPEPAKEA